MQEIRSMPTAAWGNSTFAKQGLPSQIHCPNPHPKPVETIHFRSSPRHGELFLCPVDGQIVAVKDNLLKRLEPLDSEKQTLYCPRPHPYPVVLMDCGVTKRNLRLSVCAVDGEMIETGYGVVIRFGNQNYGFIRAGNLDRIFFHGNHCETEMPIRSSNLVWFRLGFNQDGPIAQNVTVYDW